MSTLGHVSGLAVLLAEGDRAATLQALGRLPGVTIAAHCEGRAALVLEAADEHELAARFGTIALMAGVQAANIAFHRTDVDDGDVP